MILKTYARTFSVDLEASLRVLKSQVGRNPELRMKFLDMEVATHGDFCFLARPAESIKPYLGAVGPIIVDNLASTQIELERDGAEIVVPRTEVMTGWNLFTRNPDGVVIEWVEWYPHIWEQVKLASAA